MSDKLAGGCLCGAVRYECNKDEMFGDTICHCRDCQYVSWGGPGIVVAAPDSAVNLIQGNLSEYTVTGGSGSGVTRQFCGACGTPVFSKLGVAPGVTIIKLGSFDDPGFFDAKMTVWTSSAQTWAHISPDVPSFPEAPG